MSSTLWIIIGCGILSIVYAIWATQSVLAADAGNARMQEIAGAIREGAQAYLTRQYTTIAIVGVVVFVIAFLLLGCDGSHRLSDRRCVVRRCRLYRHARFGARQCAHRAGGIEAAWQPVSTSRSSPAPSPACWLPVSALLGCCGLLLRS